MNLGYASENFMNYNSYEQNNFSKNCTDVDDRKIGLTKSNDSESV